MIVLIVWAHKTSLNPPLFIEMSGQNQDSERYVYLCARGIEFVSFYDFSIGFWNCSDILVSFFLI